MEEDIEPEDVQLMDLPEPVLLLILSYVDLDTLRHTIPHVNLALRQLARTRSLWKGADLYYASRDCWDDSTADLFIRDLQATPFLRRLSLAFSPEDPAPVWSTLLGGRFEVHELELEMDRYVPEAPLLLSRHPEIDALTLRDSAVDDDITAMVAREVAILARNLYSLDLSHSRLLALPSAGQLLAQCPVDVSTSGAEWLPAVDAVLYPAGAEPLPAVHRHLRRQGRPGLQRLTYEPYFPAKMDVLSHGLAATVSASLASLIGAHRDALVRVDVDDASADVLAALATCSHLQELSVTCDAAGDGVLGLVRALGERAVPLTTLRLRVASLAAPAAPHGLADGQHAALRHLLEAVSRLDRLEELELRGAQDGDGLGGYAPSASFFPGFAALGALPRLRTLRLSDLGPVGRGQLEELRHVAAPRLPLLRKLVLSDCPCSARGAYGDCRDRVSDQLEADVPGLELFIENALVGFDDRYDFGFMAVKTCNCVRRRPQSVRARGRGGRGRGAAYAAH